MVILLGEDGVDEKGSDENDEGGEEGQEGEGERGRNDDGKGVAGGCVDGARGRVVEVRMAARERRVKAIRHGRVVGEVGDSVLGGVGCEGGGGRRSQATAVAILSGRAR